MTVYAVVMVSTGVAGVRVETITWAKSIERLVFNLVNIGKLELATSVVQASVEDYASGFNEILNPSATTTYYLQVLSEEDNEE